MSRPIDDRWCDINGAQISLFCWVEQVAEVTDYPVLFSWLYQQGEVVVRSLDQCYVRFDDGMVVSLAPQLLRLVPDAVGGR